MPVSNSPDVETMRLYCLVGCGVFYSAVARALNSVSDAAVMDVCRNCPKPHGYSYDRVRGILSLGMGLSNICCGAILAYSSFRDYQVWFVCTCALFIVAALVFPLSSIWVKNFKNSLCGNALSGGNGNADEASSGSDSEELSLGIMEMRLYVSKCGN